MPNESITREEFKSEIRRVYDKLDEIGRGIFDAVRSCAVSDQKLTAQDQRINDLKDHLEHRIEPKLQNLSNRVWFQTGAASVLGSLGAYLLGKIF